MDTISIILTLEKLNYKPCVIKGTVDNQSDYESNVFYQKDGEEILVSTELTYDSFLQQYSTANSEVQLEELRTLRNKKLQETDWTQLPDIDESVRTQWQTYRQQLRDITQSYNNVDDVVWPTKPE